MQDIHEYKLVVVRQLERIAVQRFLGENYFILNHVLSEAIHNGCFRAVDALRPAYKGMRTVFDFRICSAYSFLMRNADVDKCEYLVRAFPHLQLPSLDTTINLVEQAERFNRDCDIRFANDPYVKRSIEDGLKIPPDIYTYITSDREILQRIESIVNILDGIVFHQSDKPPQPVVPTYKC